MKKNAMKAKLLSGEPAFGISMMIPSPQIVEMVAGLGFDWILIDCEHGAINPETVETLALAADACGMTPIARPRTQKPEDILQVMDRGVMGVQVPHVNTADDARAAVEAVKYHPMGKRGLGAGTRAASYGFGVSLAEYIEATNRETLVCVQLEEEEAIRNADGILKVEGVDVFFIGPSDLSQSMGYPGQLDNPAVKAAIDSTFEKIVAAGKVPGTPGNLEGVQSVMEKGVLYLYTHVTRLLASGSAEYFKVASA